MKYNSKLKFQLTELVDDLKPQLIKVHTRFYFSNLTDFFNYLSRLCDEIIRSAVKDKQEQLDVKIINCVTDLNKGKVIFINVAGEKCCQVPLNIRNGLRLNYNQSHYDTTNGYIFIKEKKGVLWQQN